MNIGPPIIDLPAPLFGDMFFNSAMQFPYGASVVFGTLDPVDTILGTRRLLSYLLLSYMLTP